MLAVIGLVVISFSFYKFLAASSAQPPANDQPARAFQDPGVQQLVSRDFLLAPRLPADAYRRLSSISASLGRRTIHGTLEPKYLRAAGETQAEINRTLADLKPTLKEVGGLKFELRSPYQLSSVSGQTAVISATLLIFDPTGRKLNAPLSAQMQFHYQSGTTWNRVHLTSLTLNLGG